MSTSARPFVKAAGGKSAVLPQLLPLLPPRELWERHGYREPFVGGGAMFFLHASAARPTVLSDNNARLIDAYIGIRDYVEDVINELRALPYNESVYYAVRERFNAERETAPIAERAAWFIYTNRSCVNGLFRENLSGDFNVSFGAYTNPTICDAANLRACSRALRGVDIRACDFEAALADVRPGEFVFADPTYVPVDGKPSFTAYTAKRFSSVAGANQADLFTAARTDHERLADCLKRIDAAGAYFVATNSDTAEARRVYAGWEVATIKARRNINSDGGGRGEVNELVFSNARRWR